MTQPVTPAQAVDQPIEQTDATVIPLFPGATVDAPATEVPDDHWSRTLPRGRHISVYSDLITIYGTVGAAIVVGLALRGVIA